MTRIAMPKLGLTMESGRIVRWLRHPGDAVNEGDLIVVVETDKVTFEVPSPCAGILHPVCPEGRICAVEEVMGYLAQDREEYEKLLVEHPPEKIQGGDESLQEEEVPVRAAAFPEKSRVKASPLARAMAVENSLDLAGIRGTGPGGRIVREDILAALKDKARGEVRRIEQLNLPIDKEIDEAIPISGIRKVIFENMRLSLSQSAQLTLQTEACAEALVLLRERLGREGVKVSFNAILVKTAAMALRLHPRINASVEKGTIFVWKWIHIGLAMEANDALIVPVVRNADKRSIRDIDHEISLLVGKVKENRLSPDDLANGTFTISNLGFADVDHFTPIIRPPESAILGIGRILKRPVVRGDTVVPEARLGLSLTFDHRIIDGAPAARFLKTFKDMIEDPLLMLG
jgi:pyruvate/2-oxoglutarate dehydrogenase complex dihydrolipoamide acyltransferase (E2) component